MPTGMVIIALALIALVALAALFLFAEPSDAALVPLAIEHPAVIPDIAAQ